MMNKAKHKLLNDIDKLPTEQIDQVRKFVHNLPGHPDKQRDANRLYARIYLRSETDYRYKENRSR